MCGCTTAQPRNPNAKNGTAKTISHDVCVFDSEALNGLMAYELTPFEVAVVKSQLKLIDANRCNAYEKQIKAIYARLGVEVRVEDQLPVS